MQIIKGDFSQQLDLQFSPAIKAGFPSPADDYAQESLDFNRTLLLTDAKAAWAANPTTENAAEVVKKLSGISPNASNYKQVSAFIKEVESATKAEIKEEREAERTEATRSYELQKQQISAARDVAIAYAAQQTTGMKYKTLR